MIQTAKLIAAMLVFIIGVLLTLLVLDVVSFDDLKNTFGKVFLVAVIALGTTAALIALSGSDSKK